MRLWRFTVLVFVVAAWPVALLSRAAADQSGSVVLSVELPDQPTAGARLFVQKNCVRCHSLGAQPSPVGPDLGRMLFSGTMLDLAGAFWNHAPVMREKMRDMKIQPPTISSGEMADLVAFLTAYRYYLTEIGKPGSAASGARVFVAKGCVHCHDESSTNWFKVGPGLQRYRGRFSSIFLAQAMWNHGPEMASAMRASGVPWPQFSGQEMGDLLAYLQADNVGTNRERVYFEPGSPRHGRELFASKQCRACHSIAGVGGHGGPDLARPQELVRSVSEIAGLMWNHNQAMTAEFRRRGIPRVTFSGPEMADIIAYLYFVNYATVRGTPARGKEIFDRNCGACHSMGGGARVGPDLATLPGLDEPFAVLSAMWNHAPGMELQMRARTVAWPRFATGEPADLIAYLLSERAKH